MADRMALVAVFIAAVALSSPASSLPISGNLSPSDEAALKCIIEVLSGALSPAQSHSAASAECVEILRGDDRISALIHQHDLLSQLEEISGRGRAEQRPAEPPAAAATNRKPSDSVEDEVKEETKKNEEEQDEEEKRGVSHEDNKEHDANKKKKPVNDGDDDRKEEEEDDGEDETKSGAEDSPRELHAKRRESSGERRRGAAGDKAATARVPGDAPAGKLLAREQSDEEDKRGRGEGAPRIGDETEEQVAHRDNTHDEEDEEEVSEPAARHGDARAQRASHGERNAAREEHIAQRPVAEELLDYLDQIRQRLGHKQPQPQQQPRGDYSRYLETRGPLVSSKSDRDNGDEEEKIEYEEQTREAGGRRGHEEVEDDAQQREEDAEEELDDDDGDDGEEAFGDGVGRGHRWAGSVGEERRAWGAGHRAAAGAAAHEGGGDDVENEEEEEDDGVAKGGEEAEEDDEEDEEMGPGGGKEWGSDKRPQETQSRKHSTLNSKQLLELKAMEHELVKIAERLGERLG